MKDNKKKKRTAGDAVRTLILVIALGVFCFSACKLINIYLTYKQGTDEYAALEQYAALDTDPEPSVPDDTDAAAEPDGTDAAGTDSDGTEEGETAGGEEGTDYVYETETDKRTGETVTRKLYYMRNPVDFESLLKINEDIVGWLKVGAVDISYPVTQGEDDDYYLHHTFEGVENVAGCIFMEYQNSDKFDDENTVIYGHNMKNGSMFGMLRHILNEGVYEEDPYFWIYTPTYIYKYKIFNCTTVGAVSNTYTLTFATEEDFQDYLDVAAAQSQVDSADVKVTSDDRIVTLSTCTGDSSTRFVVQGKLIRKYISKK